MNIQKQAGAKDCGLFAMAMGEDPFNKQFDQGSLRRQVVDSIEQGLMKPFISMDFESHPCLMCSRVKVVSRSNERHVGVNENSHRSSLKGHPRLPLDVPDVLESVSMTTPEA